MIEFFTGGNGWLIIGLILIIIEMLLNLGYVSISLGIGSILTGVGIKFHLIPSVFDKSVIDEFLIASIASTLALVSIRIIFKKTTNTTDINEY